MSREPPRRLGLGGSEHKTAFKVPLLGTVGLSATGALLPSPFRHADPFNPKIPTGSTRKNKEPAMSKPERERTALASSGQAFLVDTASEEEFEGDDMYSSFSPEEIESVYLGSSPSRLSPPRPGLSGFQGKNNIKLKQSVDDFVFASQASLEDELNDEGIKNPSSLSTNRFRTGRTSGSIEKGSSRDDTPSTTDEETRIVDHLLSLGSQGPPNPPSRAYIKSRKVSDSSPTHPYKRSPSRNAQDLPSSTPTKQGRLTDHMFTTQKYKPTFEGKEIAFPEPEPPNLPSSAIATSAIQLSPEQRAVLELVLQGESMFFTGSAGTGKSVLLREIISELRARKRKIAITASTGIAGVNIGGQTLHAWAGLGLALEDVKTLANRIVRKDQSKKNGDPSVETALDRWTKTQVLIVDEMSMIDGRFWDKLEAVARIVRKNAKPFGGMQLVLCGDFFQLPPVPDRHDKSSMFAFEARSWRQCVTRIIKLQQVFRQSNQRFVDMLTEARLGQLSGRSIRGFACLQRPVVYPDGIDATELFPMKYQSDQANTSKLNRLKGDTRMFVSIDKEGIKPNGDSFSHSEAVHLLDQHSRAPARLDLKVGAQVMLTMNMPNIGLCNGSVGKVIGFETKTEERKRVTEELAAVLKAVSSKDDEEEVQIIAPPVKAPVFTEDKVFRHDADLAKNRWPVVEFSASQKVMIIPTEFDVISQKGLLEAKRIQVPLILAWALSIHKAQGITIPRLKVDLAKTFEKGQAYVALSRATSLETLELQNFRAAGVLAHPKVIAWAAELEAVKL